MLIAVTLKVLASTDTKPTRIKATTITGQSVIVECSNTIPAAKALYEAKRKAAFALCPLGKHSYVDTINTTAGEMMLFKTGQW